MTTANAPYSTPASKSRIRITLVIADLDYTTVLHQMLSGIQVSLPGGKPPETYAEILAMFPEQTENAAAAALDILPLAMKNLLTVLTIDKFQAELINLFREFASQHKVNITIGGISGYTDHEKIILVLTVDAVDYSSAVDLLVPVYQQTRWGRATKIAAKLAIIALPKHRKDALAVKAIHQQSAMLTTLAQTFLTQRGIAVVLNSITAKQISGDILPAS